MTDPFDEEHVRSLLSSAAVSGSSPGADTLSTIRSGAQRRLRTRRIVTSSLGVFVLVGAVATGVALRPDNSSTVRPDVVASGGSTVSPEPTSTAAPATPKKLPLGFVPEYVDANGSNWFIAAQSTALWSDDDGQTYTSVNLPSEFAASSGAGLSRGVKFVNATDGVLWFGTYAWSTTDRGTSWKQIMPANGAPGAIMGGARSDSYVYMSVLGPCAESFPIQCPNQVLRWSKDKGMEIITLKMNPGQEARSIAASGNEVWVLTTDGGGGEEHLFHSRDYASTFVDQKISGNGACLDGDLTAGNGGPTSADGPDQVIWMQCASGTMGHPRVSLDGGKTFNDTRSPGSMSNASPLVSLGSTVAIAGTEDGLKVTTNQGQTWTRYNQDSGFIPFELVATGDKVFASTQREGGTMHLWVSSDSGRTWTDITSENAG